MDLNIIHNTDCLSGLKSLPDNSVDCCVTSPPYYGLRDYGDKNQIGLEGTPEQFIEKLVMVFAQVHRVLKPSGTLWVNIGDSYAGSGKGAWKNKDAQKAVYVPDPNDNTAKMPKTWDGIKPKDLIGIPWMLAFALRQAGWYLRQDIIWNKPNAMPESVTDRCGKAHEYIFLFSKARKYYFDVEAIRQPAQTSTVEKMTRQNDNPNAVKAIIGGRKREALNSEISEDNPMFRGNTFREYEYTGFANKRSVWTVATKPFKEAHFATFPEDLIVDCIKAGCPEEGVVIDPFMGSGTTAVVARKLNRNYIGFELNPEYIAISQRRLYDNLGMFK